MNLESQLKIELDNLVQSYEDARCLGDRDLMTELRNEISEVNNQLTEFWLKNCTGYN